MDVHYAPVTGIMAKLFIFAPTMTNVELLRQEAVKALDAGTLNDKQKAFIESIRNFDKKQLKKLNSSQFKWLKDIAKLHTRSTEESSQSED